MDSAAAARWHIGPPAPSYLRWVGRLLSFTSLGLVGYWVRVHLGGVGVTPRATPVGNDTGPVFNWHPILMTLAFVVCMSEAVLTYQAPLLPSWPRETRKKVHWGLHTTAALCALLGVVAAFRSHTLKLPDPIPNLYSPHSWLGLAVLALMGLQFLVGFSFYLYPRAALPQRVALGPVHRFSGMAVWLLGLAAVATGLQEKATFLQMGKALSGDALYGGALRIPALLLLLLAALAMAVLYHQVPPAKGSGGGGGNSSETMGLLRADRMEDDSVHA